MIKSKRYLDTLLYYLESSEETLDNKEFLNCDEIYSILQEEAECAEHKENYIISKDGLANVLANYPQLMKSIEKEGIKYDNMILYSHRAFFRFYSLNKIAKMYDLEKKDIENNLKFGKSILRKGNELYIALISWLDIIESNIEELENLEKNINYVVLEYLKNRNILVSKKILTKSSKKLLSGLMIEVDAIKEFYKCLLQDARLTLFDEYGELQCSNYEKLLQNVKREDNKIVLFKKPKKEEVLINKLLKHASSETKRIFDTYAAVANYKILEYKEEQEIFQHLHNNIAQYCMKLAEKPFILFNVLKEMNCDEKKLGNYFFANDKKNNKFEFLEAYKKMYEILSNAKNSSVLGRMKEVTKKFFSEFQVNHLFVIDTYKALEKLVFRTQQDLKKTKDSIPALGWTKNEYLAQYEKETWRYNTYKELFTELHENYKNIDTILFLLVCYNIRLITKIALKYTKTNLSLEDKIQEGVLGILKAITKYDYTKGYKFGTYAIEWITQYISSACLQQENMLPLTKGHAWRLSKIERFIQQYIQENHQEPSEEEIAAATKFSKELIKKILSYKTNIISLDLMMGENKDIAFTDIIKDVSVDIEKNLERLYEKQKISNVLKTLEQREEQVLRLRYGIGTDREHTLEEIGKMLNISKERVRQIEKKALKKLRFGNLLKILMK